MTALAAVAVLLPFAAAFAGMIFGPTLSHLLTPLARRVRRTQPTAVGRRRVLARRLPANGPALLAVLPVAAAQWQRPGVRRAGLTVVRTGGAPISVSVDVDGTAAIVALLVCGVALAVQIYSVAYMRDDPRYSSYAAFISLFTAAMLLVVYSGDLLVLYAGWEVMGVCSYFLIGHHWHDRATSAAAVKAFLVTRIGDVGFLLGVIVLGASARSFEIRTVLGQVPAMPHTTVVVATLLLLCGVAGKSAQFPLHTWLPDAMAGPVPVSALIHAATMVAAGVYVVARLYPAFLSAPGSLAVLGVVAAVSMLGAALAALAQDDLKRVLAYSTISQLAYMMGGLAVGARDGALFHLLTHGAAKALLFLGAGVVIVAVGSNLMSAMGGLRHAMPVTFWSMTAGFAALAGCPPASGFFSKDAILSQAWRATRAGGVPAIPAWTGWLVLVAGLLTTAATAAYATRAWLVTFLGERREPASVRGTSSLMRWPVAALAVPALVLGFLGLGSDHLRPGLGISVVSLLFALAGGGGVFLVWNRDPAVDPVHILGSARPLLRDGFRVDAVYSRLVVRPVTAVARLVARADERLLDRAVTGTARGTRRLGGLLRVTENGDPQAYVSGVLAGVVIIVLAVVVLT